MKKQIILTAGLPASGKSSTLRNSIFSHLPCVDPDQEKKFMIGFDPKNPHLVHEESKLIARRKHLKYLSENVSFIVDGTGTNIEKYIQWVNEAKELGYEVILFYCKVRVETSIKRNALRKRNVPESVILEKAGIINQSTELIGSICDQFIVVEND